MRMLTSMGMVCAGAFSLAFSDDGDVLEPLGFTLLFLGAALSAWLFLRSMVESPELKD